MAIRYLGGINSPSYNPLAANVTTGVTTVQQGGIYTTSSAAQANGVEQWIGDPLFNRSPLLLQADNAVNGAQNNTFLDSSLNNFTVTRNALTTQGSFSPFSLPNGWWSNYFDGTGDYLVVTGSSNLAFGSNNFTIEFFVYLNAFPAANQVLYDARASGGTTTLAPALYVAQTTNVLSYFTNNAVRITGTTVLRVGQWYHVLLSRVSGTTRMFLNGVQEGSNYTDANVYINGASRPVIAAAGDSTGAGPVNGYISNLRVLNGTGVTSVTVPTSPLTAIANTQLLTCQSNRFVDNSTNAYTITKNGDAAIVPFSAFNNAPTYNGPEGVQSTFLPGANNYALINQSLIPIDQQTFTIEAWVYLTANEQQVYPELICDDATNDFNWNFGIRNSRKISFMWRTGLNVYNESRGLTSLALNTWNHIAISVNGNTIWLYLNGVADLSSANALSSRMQVDNKTAIGGIPGAGSSFFYKGFVSNLSVLNGVGKYPNGTTFTPPTAPLPVNAAGQVLLFARPGPLDSNQTVAPKTVTITGTVPTSPSSPFGTVSGFPLASGSAYFDGNSSLSLTGSSALAFGFDDFSIEFWAYLPSPGTTQILYDSRPNGVASGVYPTIYTPSGIITYFVSGLNRIAANAASPSNTWIHVVVSRDTSGITRMFINGVAQTQTYTDSNNYLNGASRPILGRGDNPASTLIVGYISNLRVIRGTGVTSVTVPTAPVTAVPNTQLLLNFTNGGIVDATRNNTFSTVGNAQVSTGIKKYGSGSMFFDGTGDWLLVQNSPEINLSTGDFTIECWINCSNTTTARSIAGKGVASTTGWEIYMNASPTLLIFVYGGAITYSSNYNFNIGQWYHIAIVRAGTGIGNIRMFVDGFLIFESATAITNDISTTNPLYIGAGKGGATPFLGYIDDFRITKGVARYTSTFIPPATALPRQGQGNT